MSDALQVGAVVIGRNEGERLIRCLAALAHEDIPIVYVDSGSTDGSIAAARNAGATVLELDSAIPFTAARARNAGLAELTAGHPDLSLVQLIDGDCELQPGWIETGAEFLRTRPEVAVACGRVRERHPQSTIYNRLADREWDTPLGETRACGGIALIRIAPLQEMGGFRTDLIAGEEPELCVRLRSAGWKIWRLDAEMVLHDIAMTRFTQWWRRARRGGHAAAEGAALHGGPPERHKVAEVRKALFWGALLPAATLAGLIFTPWAMLLLLAWPAQVLRLRRRKESWDYAVFTTLAKLPEAQGVLEYWWRRGLGRRAGLIEYK